MTFVDDGVVDGGSLDRSSSFSDDRDGVVGVVVGFHRCPRLGVVVVGKNEEVRFDSRSVHTRIDGEERRDARVSVAPDVVDGREG